MKKLVAFIRKKKIFQYLEGAEDFTKQRREETCDRKKTHVEEVFHFLVFFVIFVFVFLVFLFLTFSETTLLLILYCNEHTAIWMLASKKSKEDLQRKHFIL